MAKLRHRRRADADEPDLTGARALAYYSSRLHGMAPMTRDEADAMELGELRAFFRSLRGRGPASLGLRGLDGR